MPSETEKPPSGRPPRGRKAKGEKSTDKEKATVGKEKVSVYVPAWQYNLYSKHIQVYNQCSLEMISQDFDI